jgi:hypothetical protein
MRGPPSKAPKSQACVFLGLFGVVLGFGGGVGETAVSVGAHDSPTSLQPHHPVEERQAADDAHDGPAQVVVGGGREQLLLVAGRWRGREGALLLVTTAAAPAPTPCPKGRAVVVERDEPGPDADGHGPAHQQGPQGRAAVGGEEGVRGDGEAVAAGGGASRRRRQRRRRQRMDALLLLLLLRGPRPPPARRPADRVHAIRLDWGC